MRTGPAAVRVLPDLLLPPRVLQVSISSAVEEFLRSNVFRRLLLSAGLFASRDIDRLPGCSYHVSLSCTLFFSLLLVAMATWPKQPRHSSLRLCGQQVPGFVPRVAVSTSAWCSFSFISGHFC